MPIQKPYYDSNTGLSLGNALWVIGEVINDTRQHKATILQNVYVGLAEYSGGRQPLNAVPIEYPVSGIPYLNGVENPLRQRAATYIQGLPEFSGGVIV